MEKSIKLIMGKDKILQICVDNVEKHTIYPNDRSISAEKIYELFGFSVGDHYSITSESQENSDKQVLEFFAKLFQDIADKVNSLNSGYDKEESESEQNIAELTISIH